MMISQRSLAALMMVVLCQTIFAQTNPPSQKKVDSFFKIGGQFFNDAELDQSGGQLGSDNLEAAFGIRFQPGNKWQFELEAAYSQNVYDFSSTPFSYLDDAGLDEYESQQLSARVLYIQSPKIFWFANAGLSAGLDKDAAFSDANLLGISGGLIWRKSERFTLITGVFFDEEFDGDDQLFPFIGFQWQVNDRFQLNLDRRLEGVFQIQPKWSFAIFAEYKQENYRFNKKAPVANGTLEDDRALTGLEFAWNPTRSFKVELQAGMVPFGELEIKDEAGFTQAKEELEPETYGSLRFTFSF